MWSPASFATNAWTQQFVLLLASITLAVAGHSVYTWLTTTTPHRRRPHGTLPILYNTLGVVQHKHRLCDWLVDMANSVDGKPFWLKMVAGPDAYVVTTPPLLEDVLKTHADAFDKGSQMHVNLFDLVGDGIFGADGATWLRQRKTASHLFSLRSLRDSMAVSIQKHALVLNSIFAQSVGTSIDLIEQLNRFATETFAEIGFGVELGALRADADHPFQSAFDGAQRLLMQRFTAPPALWQLKRYLNVGSERLLKQYIHVIDDTVYTIIHKALAKRQGGMENSSERVVSELQTGGATDLVSLFLANNVSSSDDDDDDGSTTGSSTIDPVFLRDVVVNFLIAGRDTTAQALSWFFYLLSQHPQVELTIRNELATIVPDLVNGSRTTVSMEQASELVYLDAVLRETLRLHPSVPLNSRFANRDVVLCDGTLIRKGGKVSVVPYVIGRMRHIWGDDALAFKPERWLDPVTGKLVPVSPFKFPSFNAGPRACPGQSLAMMEMKITVATVLSKFRLTLVPGQHVTYDLSLTHPIKGELRMHVAAVEAVAGAA